MRTTAAGWASSCRFTPHVPRGTSGATASNIPMDLVVHRVDQVLGRWRCPLGPSAGVELSQLDTSALLSAAEPRVGLVERLRHQEIEGCLACGDREERRAVAPGVSSVGLPHDVEHLEEMLLVGCIHGPAAAQKCTLRRETPKSCPSCSHVNPEMRRNSETARLGTSVSVTVIGSVSAGAFQESSPAVRRSSHTNGFGNTRIAHLRNDPYQRCVVQGNFGRRGAPSGSLDRVYQVDLSSDRRV